ncbi:MAG TPA: hypothetical protein VLA58_02560 [Chitinophagaceae bacterium]|nr:hypothetical protein [Chitinophagaceae bacterium]
MRNKILILLLFLPVSLWAQKNVDLDKFGFSVQLRSLPQVRLDSTYRTYNVEIESTRLMQSFMKEVDPERIVVLDGWRKLPEGGHVIVNVKLDDLLPESFSIVERVENIKDRMGKITGTRTLYSQEVTYSFAATAVVMDYKGMHIYDQQLISREQKQKYRSPEFPVRQVAEGYFMLNSIKLTSDLYRQNVTRAMHNLSNRLSNDFGYAEVTSNDYMWIVGSRKHPEYDAHRKAFQQMNSVLFGMDANTHIPDLKVKMKPVIDYFEGIKKRYNSTSKHDRKIRYASFFNLAVIYYYLDDPQSMMKEANGLVLNDFDSRDGKGFESVALRLKNQMQMANVTSRHFPIDVTKFKGPYEPAQPVLSKTD